MVLSLLRALCFLNEMGRLFLIEHDNLKTTLRSAVLLRVVGFFPKFYGNEAAIPLEIGVFSYGMVSF